MDLNGAVPELINYATDKQQIFNGCTGEYTVAPPSRKLLNHDNLMNISWLISQYLKKLMNISSKLINISS